MKYQRNMQCCIIDKDPVGLFLMLSQSFPMVPCQDDNRVFGKAALMECVQKDTDPVIRIGDFPIIGSIRVFGRERGRGIILHMGIEIVHPEKEGFGIPSLQPLNYRMGNTLCTPLLIHECLFLFTGEVVII